MINRAPLWRQAVREYAEEVNGEVFRWGETDCASIVRGALCAMYAGHDFWTHVYGAKNGARRILKKRGGWDALLTSSGLLRVLANHAQEGDVVLTIDDDGVDSVGIIVGGRVLTAHHDEGVIWSQRPDGHIYRPPGGSAVGVSENG